MDIICIFTILAFRVAQDKHFDGSFISVWWKRQKLWPFTFPLPQPIQFCYSLWI